MVLALGFGCLSHARFSAGVSWGYSPQIFKSQVFSYTPNRIGYRINERNQSFTYFSNAYVDIDAGVDFLRKFSLHLKTGYRGADFNYDLIPFLLEGRFYFRDYCSGGAFIALEGGIAMHKRSFDDGIIILKTAFGYREQLYRDLSVDFLVHVSAMNFHPLPVDKYEGVIPRPQVSYSVVGLLQLGFGVGINF